jgi:ActR/RegA family two-component response regulator
VPDRLAWLLGERVLPAVPAQEPESTILLACADEVLAPTVADELSRAVRGLHLIVARTLGEALAAAEGEAPDVVVADAALDGVARLMQAVADRSPDTRRILLVAPRILAAAWKGPAGHAIVGLPLAPGAVAYAVNGQLPDAKRSAAPRQTQAAVL